MKKIEGSIDARELKGVLLGKSNFCRWIKEIIEKYDLKNDKDYFLREIKLNATGKIKMIKRQYYLTENASKKIIYSQKRSQEAKNIKQRLEKGENLEEILNELMSKNKEEISVIKYEDKEYPEQLRKIKNPPKQLYVKGSIENLKENGIVVIGTRDCTNYGRKTAKNFTNNLVGYNLNIISGLALGIDSCAHKACIEAKGKTIAVLPSGFDNIFPIENEELVNKILKSGGTVITEYPPEFEKTQESCRERNRIMSGLAIATLVVEAKKRSGTSITVGYANEQNKKAFCIPSSLLNSKGIGTNKMIKENKAQMVTEVEDIIKEFPELKLERKANFVFSDLETSKTTKEKNKKTKSNIKIEEENLEIYNFLEKEPKTIDEMAQELNKPINEIGYKLTMLELQGAIEKMPGNKFKVK